MAVELRAEYWTEIGKSAVRKLRAAGMLPAVMYGHGEETKPIKINAHEFEKLWHKIKGESVIINLKLGDTSKLAVIQDIARHPVTGKILHVDFHLLHKGEKVEVTVPVITVGTPKGVKMGGILEHIMRELTIRALPDNIPPHIEIDVSELGLGDSIHVKDVKIEGIEIVEDPEEPIVTVIAPHRAVIEEKVEEVEEEAAPTEEAKPAE